MIFIVRHTYLYFNFMKDRRKILRDSKSIMCSMNYIVGFWQSRYFKIMLIEIVVCAVHNPPGLKDTVVRVDQMGKRLRYAVSTYITAFMILRIYLLFRLYSRFSRFRSTFADRCCAKIGIEADTSFSLKCIYMESPFGLLFFTFFTSAIAIGFAVRLFER